MIKSLNKNTTLILQTMDGTDNRMSTSGVETSMATNITFEVRLSIHTNMVKIRSSNVQYFFCIIQAYD